VNCPRSTNPSLSSACECRLDLAGSEAERGSHRPDRHRPQALQAQAHQLNDSLFTCPGAGRVLARRVDRRIEPAVAMDCSQHRERLGGDPELSPRRVQPRSATRCDQRSEQRRPARPGALLACYDTQRHQRIVQLIRTAGLGPGLLAHGRDRRGVEPAHLGRGRRIEPASRRDGLSTSLLERCIVEIRIWPGREDLRGER
jgi:hypothetical protein